MEALNTTTKIPTASPASHHQNKPDANAKEDAIQMLPPVFFQPKLTVGPPDDPLEKEADDMSDKVMRMPLPEPISFSSGKNIVSRKCTECEEEEKLHRKESNSDSTSVAPPIVHDVLNSPGGKTLNAETRSFMEPRFNYDFSNVKIHDNDLAAKSAGSINALAYTSGNNIVFNSGQYNTNSDAGKKLLAHELTHVVQQQNSTYRKIIQKAPCIAGAVCTTNAAAPGDFSESEEALEAPARAAIAALPPAAVTASGHGRRATHIERIVNSYRGTYEFPVAPTVLGIFVDTALSDGTGAMLTDCASFATSVPRLSCGTRTHIIVTHNEIELQANTYLTSAPGTIIPFGPAIWGESFERGNWLIELLRMMRHETQHAVFNAAVAAGAVANSGTCTMATVLGSGQTVAFDLSEVSAIITAFQVIEKGFRRGRLNATSHADELTRFRSQVIATSGESVIGAIKDIKCTCDCADADRLLVNAFNFTTRRWSASDRTNLNLLLQAELRAFWPVFTP